MKDVVQLQKIMYPDLLQTMQQRYSILYTVFLFNPIGRRGIVTETRLPERFVRKEIEFLQQQGFIYTTTKGVEITEDGKSIITELQSFIRESLGLTTLERQLEEMMLVDKVIVVSGDSDTEPLAKQELGRATVSYLADIIKADVTIAVTGGTTMAAVAEAMVPVENASCMFVPARGGIGEEVDYQANTIAAKMALAEKGNYRLLYVPDPLSEALYQTMIHEESIKETLTLIRNAPIVLHGIGEALTLAKQRRTSGATLDKLFEEEATGEAFGYYFNESGNIVHKHRTIGIQLEDLISTEAVITVAGGTSKAKAIASFMKQRKTDVLITDEAAANEIVAKKLI